MPKDDAKKYVIRARDMLDAIVDNEGFVAEAMELALELRHSVYDMIYLAVARNYHAVLLTADKR